MRKKEEIFSVPEGYFSSLEMKLSYIPSRAAAAEERLEAGSSRAAGPEAGSSRAPGSEAAWPAGVFRRRGFLLPGISLGAVAACLLLAFGFHFFRSTPSEDVLDIYERYYLADLIPLTDPDMIFDMTTVPEECTLEEIEEYLIETGMSLSMIEQFIQ